MQTVFGTVKFGAGVLIETSFVLFWRRSCEKGGLWIPKGLFYVKVIKWRENYRRIVISLGDILHTTDR